MGTNYYYYAKPPCPTCHHHNADDRLHIGKVAGGWCFSLHIYPELGIHDLPDWLRLFSAPGSVIESEYREVITPEAMEATIRYTGFTPIQDDRKPPYGHDSWAAFHHINESEPGPMGLMRNKVGPICAGHGAGTWDLIARDFS